MKIVVEITVDEREWFARKRRALGPFAPLSSEALLGSLGDTVLEWAAGAPNAVHARVLCDDNSRSHEDGGCCEPGESSPVVNVEARLKALEAWAARACGDYAFNEDAHVEVGKYELESLTDRVNDLESRLPTS